MLMLVSMTLTVMQSHSGSAKAKKISVDLSRQLSKQSALKLFRDLDCAIIYKYGLTILFFFKLTDGLDVSEAYA